MITNRFKVSQSVTRPPHADFAARCTPVIPGIMLATTIVSGTDGNILINPELMGTIALIFTNNHITNIITGIAVWSTRTRQVEPDAMAGLR